MACVGGVELIQNWLIAAKTGRMFGFWQNIKKKDGLINRLLTRCQLLPA